ncbi:hypothetical protein CLV30_101151 [Haloactinopolyspora alba]|uniref:Uncharacterized protein n=1 Tax=Haloactinopolyspora alba TaxID=648780 RepID=A0A2P8EFH5_9ACTN|nr:hypothetical protein [Haloactinopolyspora alba]PSL08184.1 hypothetical protein CLV30_101151 [Haloactinopolyspora alba]
MIFDVRTDDGLRQALARMPQEGGWDGPLGRVVISALWDKASALVNRQRSDVRDAHRVPHLVGLGWEYLAQHAAYVAGARSPWAVLHTVMRRQARAAELGDELGVSERRARESTRTERRVEAHTATRLGVDHPPTDHVGDPTQDPTAGAAVPAWTGGWDAALRELRDQLVAAGAPAAATDDAISAVLDVLSTVRRSHAHTEVYQSTRLDGLDRDQRRALLELLIGTRRGGPASSAWLALRQAPERGELPWASIDRAAAARFARFASPFRQATRARESEFALSAA